MTASATQPLISIVIPVYNGSDWLADAIDSALAQTYRNIEVIVVNDGSDDAGTTADIIRQYGDQIRAIDQRNGGVAAALNAGIAAMRGQYFSWLSHDDLYLPQKLATQLAVARRHSEPVIVCGNVTTIMADGSVAERINLFGTAGLDDPGLWHVLEGRISGCSLLVPKVCFDQCGGFDTLLPTTQDYDLWFRMAKRFRFVASFDYLTQSRLHPAQGSRDPRHLDEAAITWMRLFDPLPEGVGGNEIATTVRLAQSRPAVDYPGINAFARRRLTAARANIPITLVADASEYADGIRARGTLESFGYGQVDLVFTDTGANTAPGEFVDRLAVMRRHGRLLAAPSDSRDLIRAVGSIVDPDRILAFVSAARFADAAAVQRDIDRITAGQVDASLWAEGAALPPWGQFGRARIFLRAAARAGRPEAIVQELAMAGSSAPADRPYPPRTPAALPLPVPEMPRMPTPAVPATPSAAANRRRTLGSLQPATRRAVATGRIARLGNSPLSRLPRRLVISPRSADWIIGFGERTGAPGRAFVEWVFGIRGQVDSGWYKAKYAASMPRRTPASLHYLREGWRLGYDPSPLFSTSIYLRSVLFPPTINPLSHAAFFGWGFGTAAGVRYGRGTASSLIRRIATSPALVGPVLSLLSRFQRVIGQPHRGPVAAIAEWLFAVSGMIDRTWYAGVYPESVASGADPSLHYLSEGWRKGYDPSPRFSTTENATGLGLLEHLNPLSRSAFSGRTIVTDMTVAPLEMPLEQEPAIPTPTPAIAPQSGPTLPRIAVPALPVDTLLVLSDGTTRSNRWSYLVGREFARRPFVLHGELRSDGSLQLRNQDRHWACRLPDQFEAAVALLREWGVRRIDVVGSSAAEPAQMFLDACDVPFDLTALNDLDEQPTSAARQLLLRAERIIAPSRQAAQHWRAQLSKATIVAADAPGLRAAARFRVKARSLSNEALRVLIVANGRAQDRDALVAQTANCNDAIPISVSILAEEPIVIDLPSVEQCGQYAAPNFFRVVGGVDPHVIWIATGMSAATDPAIEAAMRTGLPMLVTGSVGAAEPCERRPLSASLEDPDPTEIRAALHRLARGVAPSPESQPPADSDFYTNEYLSWRSDAR